MCIRDRREGVQIEAPVGQGRADHHPGRAGRHRRADVPRHDSHVVGIHDEVPRTRPRQHVHRKRTPLDAGFDLSLIHI